MAFPYRAAPHVPRAVPCVPLRHCTADARAAANAPGREVLAVGPQSLQKILRSCDYYTEKCDGKDRELGGACRMVRELAKEVREQVEIIDRKSTEAAGEHDRMSTLLEQYLTVFTADSSLKTDLASVLGQEWVGARGHSVLTPEVLNDALAECCSLIHVLRRDLLWLSRYPHVGAVSARSSTSPCSKHRALPVLCEQPAVGLQRARSARRHAFEPRSLKTCSDFSGR